MDNTGKKLPRSFGWSDIERLKPKKSDYASIMNGPMERPKPVTGSANLQTYAHQAPRPASAEELLPIGENFFKIFGRR